MQPALRRLSAGILLSTAICRLVLAGSVPSIAGTTLSLPTIVVTPSYIPTTIERAGSTVTVIDRERIAESGAGSVAELLRHVALSKLP